MRGFSRIVSFLFHPIFIPFAGTLIYFIVTPKYSPLEVQSGNILPIFILTIIIPIISFLILRNLGIVHSVFLTEVAERKYPLYIHIALLFLILIKVIPNNYTIELYYFILGLILASTSSLLLLFLKFKSSLHMMGMGSLLMYLVALSIHFETNVVIAICLLTMALGLAATARLYLKAHGITEILIGLFIGILSQLILVQYWI